jgi:hypothetical protein
VSQNLSHKFSWVFPTPIKENLVFVCVNKSALDRLWLQGTFKSQGQGRQRVNDVKFAKRARITATLISEVLLYVLNASGGVEV